MPDESSVAGHDEFPLAESRAAEMLRAGLRRAKEERGKSLRRIGADLGYKQAVVLSHMASGRVPIPLDRSLAIAASVGLDRAEFVLAVIAQKAPTAAAMLVPADAAALYIDPFMQELRALAGCSLDKLSEDHKRVLREVITDRSPARRWLSLSELSTILAIREVDPEFQSRGLDPASLNALLAILDS